ncbi:MAG TPA: HlyD family secretion protein [Acidobacteriaceae bacterium]|nr:HlyD family secretion protein [Acidobacteriaceae bacterium]
MADQDRQGQGGTQTVEPVAGNGPGNGAAAVQPEPPAKRGQRRFIIIAVVLLLAIVAGFLYWRSSFTESTDDAQVDGDLYQVSARVAGQVTKVYVKEDQTVHAGDPIADIDPSDYQVALEQAEANLANAKAEYVQATSNVPITSVSVRTTVTTSGQDVQNSAATVAQAQAQAQAAQARILQAQANALKAQTDVDRYTPLVARDVISKQQYDAAVATATAAQASVDEAQRSAAAAQQQVLAAQQRLASARSQQAQNQQNAPKQIAVQNARATAANASVQQAQARVDQAKLNLSYCKIVAPIDGIVSRKNVAIGNNLSVGQSLLTVVPLQNLFVTANFKETQLKGMRPGQEVDIKVDALGGRKFTGRVTEIGGATGSRLSLFPPENATGNYVKVVQRIPVRIDFTNLQNENQDHALRAGMSVEPDVHVK